MDFNIFGGNVTDKVTYAIKRRFNMPPQVTCASALPGKNAKTRKSHISLNWIVLHTQCTCALSFWKKKRSSVMCLIASNICWDIVRYPIIILSIDFNSRLDEEQLPSFTQWLTPWQTWLIQSMWVTDSRMLCFLSRSCVVHPVDRFDSEWWFSSDHVIFWTMFYVFWSNKHAAFKYLSEKTQFSSFLFPQVAQKH